MALMVEPDRGSCEGYVFVHSQEKTKAVSSEGWSVREVKRLCQDLSCGDYRNHSAEELRVINDDKDSSLWEKSYDCANTTNPRNIWECEREKQPSVKNKKQLYVQCQGKIDYYC